MKTLSFLKRYIRPYLTYYVIGLVFIPFGSYCAVAIPDLTGVAIDSLHQDSPNLDEVYSIGKWILVYAIGRGIGLFASRFFIISASRKMEFDLRNHLYGHLTELDRNFYDSARTGDLMSRATLDVEAARTIAGPAIMYSFNCFCMLAVTLPYMLEINPLLTALTLIPLGFLTYAVRRIGPRVHVAFKRAQETLASISSFAQENFGGMRVVKAFAIERRETEAFRGLCDEYYKQSLATDRISNWMGPIVGAMGELATLTLMLVGAKMLLDGTLSHGEYIAFSFYQVMLIWPMISIGWVVNQVYRGVASIDRLDEILSAKSTVVTAPLADEKTAGGPALPSDPASFHGELTIKNLSFSFGRHKVLEDISLNVPAGKTVALLGHTGSGKSTLVSLIPRLYQPPPGTVFLDGIDVNQIPLPVLRKAIGFVPQVSFLFSRSIAENVAYGVWDRDDSALPAKIESFGAISRLDKDRDQFGRGYEEIVGERGVTLSGGQKQRVAISRALIVQPKLLVFDDALSAVDTHTEEEILANLKRETREMSVLIVSHRISSLKDADYIYVLDNGRIGEEGTHEELLERRGIYESLYRQQLLRTELEDM